MRTASTIFLLCAVSVVGQVPPLPGYTEPTTVKLSGKAATTFDSTPIALPEPPATITVAWNKNAETNIIGYWVFTNLTRAAFTNSTNFTMLLPTGTNSYSVTASNSFGLESAMSKLVWWPESIANVITLSASVTNWTPLSWTNPPTIPAGTSRFFRVSYGSNSAEVVTSPSLLGPWTSFANWTKLTTTNRNINLKVESKRIPAQ